MKSQIPVLLVEDDEVDIMTIRRALRDLGIANPLQVARDGEEALASLRSGAADTPGIILLDLNMPRMSGLEFLQVVKQDEALRRIPVVVFTASREDSDRLDAFGLGIAGYMVKPPTYPQLTDMIRTIDAYWTHSELAARP